MGYGERKGVDSKNRIYYKKKIVLAREGTRLPIALLTIP